MKIGIIGFGSMGQAIYSGLRKDFSKENLFIAKHSNRLPNLSNVTTVKLQTLVSDSDVVILAVRASALRTVLSRANEMLSHKLIISVIAGVGTNKLYTLTGSSRVIYAMPNISVAHNSGLIIWNGSSDLSQPDKDLATRVFSILGSHFEMKDSQSVHDLTPVCGSGPAYILNFCKFLEKIALKNGATIKQAKVISKELLIGTSKLFIESDKSFNDVITSIARPGGTTEAGLRFLDKNNFSEILNEALDLATDQVNAVEDKI